MECYIMGYIYRSPTILDMWVCLKMGNTPNHHVHGGNMMIAQQV